jgi:hypothetical protein
LADFLKIMRISIQFAPAAQKMYGYAVMMLPSANDVGFAQ